MFLQIGYFRQRESRVIHSYETAPLPLTAHVPYCSLIALISWAAARDAATRAAFTRKLLQRPLRKGAWQTGAGKGSGKTWITTSELGIHAHTAAPGLGSHPSGRADVVSVSLYLCRCLGKTNLSPPSMSRCPSHVPLSSRLEAAIQPLCPLWSPSRGHCRGRLEPGAARGASSTASPSTSAFSIPLLCHWLAFARP